ncbi:MAG TPA: glycosyltransferase [Bacteroidia bacterium]|nr:glycosyltransferase [Bacteroidia bacterium]
MKLSIVIVNYNVQHFLEQCLYSIRKATKNVQTEVWVVDNNSVDGSVGMIKEKFPEVKLIENKKNVGFSAANNQAIKQSTGEYVLILNPDTVVEEETFSKTIAFMDSHPEAGALGVKMLDGTGDFLPESKRALPTPEVAFYKIFGLAALFPKSKRFGKYHLSYLSQDDTNEIDVLSGAFMLMRKAALDKAGLLDESFFMYGEDIDMSYRITQAGYKNYYFPETRIIHYKGESTKKGSVNYVIMFYSAMRIFAQKHFSKQNARLFSSLINAAIFFRASIAIARRFIDKMFLPLADFIIIYTGYYFISLFYEHIKFSSTDYFSGNFLLIILPSYILIWIFCILFSGGYDKPMRHWKTIRGILWGTGLILILYALLPDRYRFSRALILIGSAWVLIALSGIRQLLRILKVPGFGKNTRRLLVIGKEDECKRVSDLLSQTGIKTSDIRYADPANTVNSNGSKFSTWNEIITIYNINEVIFCAKDLSTQLIMDAMSSIPRTELEFKIAPPESWAIIGSNSIHTSGELYVIDVHAINTTPNIRDKRILDIVLSFFLLLFSPLLMWVEKKPFGFIQNIFSVLIRNSSWVGYAPDSTANRLPKIKKGILSTIDTIKPVPTDSATIHNFNSMYARDYHVLNDLKVIWKGFRNLGR